VKLGIAAHSLGVGHQPEALFEATARLGLTYLGMGIPDWQQPANVDKVARLRDRYGIELETYWGDDFIGNGANQPTDGFRHFVEAVCKPLSITVVGVCANSQRFRKDPPLARQLDQLVAAWANLAPVAQELGVTLAVENHADYRGHEVVTILERINSPAVRARLDTANAYAVIEQPEVAAEAMAPYVVTTHIKDVIVWPQHPTSLLNLVGCGLGEGDVDLVTCVRLLAERASDPTSLALTLEIEPPRGTDLARMTTESVAYARQHFAAYL